MKIPNGLKYILGILAIFFGYKLAKKYLLGGTPFFGLFGASEGEKAANDLIKSVPSPNTSKLTLTDSQAYKIVNDLVTAMGGNADGTDEDSIYTAFMQIVNQDDMRLVYKKFGVRMYGGWAWGGEHLDLTGWLKNELSDDELLPIQLKLSWI